MISSDAFFLFLHHKGWHPDEDPVVLGRYSGLSPEAVKNFVSSLAHQFHPCDIWSRYENEFRSEERVRELRAEAERMSDRVQALIRSGSNGNGSNGKDVVSEAIRAHYLFRHHEGKGPYGDGQWMHRGRISTRRLGPKPFALAKHLYERMDQQVSMDTVIGEGGLFDDGTDYATIGRQCSNITTFFRDEKMPWKVSASTKDRSMIMKCLEDSAAAPTTKSP